jgi:hypothetical protein
MTRQAQVVRTGSRSGPASPRELGGGAVIHCLLNACGQTWYGGGSAGGIEVAAADPYQRFYFSATIYHAHMFMVPSGESVPGYVALNCEGTDLSVITVMDEFATLTGIIDLPAGLHVVDTLVLPWDFGAGVTIDGIAMQCIEGQTLESPTCGPQGGGSG